MGTDDAWNKKARRLRELSRDPAVAAYLLGRLCAQSSTDDLADLVEACLVYRERFGASGNDRREASAQVVAAAAFESGFAWTHGQREALRELGLPDL